MIKKMTKIIMHILQLVYNKVHKHVILIIIIILIEVTLVIISKLYNTYRLCNTYLIYIYINYN